MPVSKRTASANQDQKREPGIIPYWQSSCGRAVVYVDDNIEVMTAMDAEQFHAVVTDPPYGLEFMGKAWDAPWKNNGKIETCDEGMNESHPRRDGTQRVQYGNKHLHKVNAQNRRESEMGDPVKAKYLRHNVEYVRDSHLFQEWFIARAKAMLRVAKPGAHLLSFGGTRMWHRMTCAVEDAGWDIRDTVMWVYGSGFPKSHDVSKAIDKLMGVERTEVIAPGTAALSQGQFNSRQMGAGGYGYKDEYNVTAPATDEARQWSGWGTALKPSHEPIILARKPTGGTVVRCVLEHGTGALNIDGCRVGVEGGCKRDENTPQTPRVCGNVLMGSVNGSLAVERSPTQEGLGRWPANLIHDGSDEVTNSLPEGSSRFFYNAKADHTDRPHGNGKDVTTHPTVKPLDLMRYLVRLVCVHDGVVLDPFMGSGSTGCAAILEGMRFVGIEQSREYADIAVGRLKLALAEMRTGAGESAPPQTKRMRGT